MSEPTDPGTRTEYAVRFDAPAEFKGVVTDIRNAQVLAEGAARRASDDLNGEYRCTVVQREVTYGEWTEAQR